MTRTTVIALAVAAIFAAAGPWVAAEGQEVLAVTMSPMNDATAGFTPIPRTTSMLTRTAEGISIDISTRALGRENALSVWWLLFVDGCGPDSTPCNGLDPATRAVTNATGGISDRWGQGRFVGHITHEEIDAAIAAAGLDGVDVDAGTGGRVREIHVVMVSHGAAWTLKARDLLDLAMSTPTGGCGITARNECFTAQGTIHPRVPE